MAGKGAKGKGHEIGSQLDDAFNWVSNVKRAWMFILGALAVGVVIGLFC